MGDVATCPSSCQGFRDLQRCGVTLGAHTADSPLLKPLLVMLGGCLYVPTKDPPTKGG